MVMRSVILILIAAAWSFDCSAEDTITLNDGRTISGTIDKEDADNVTITLTNGDQRAVSKVRIAKIERGSMGAAAVAKGPEKAPETGEPKKIKPLGAKAEEPKITAEQLALVKEMGAIDPAKRQAALERFKREPETYLPAALALLNPKVATDEYTRIRILRAIGELGPLNEQTSKTLAYVSTHDPYVESRREACATIRKTGLDDAMRELLRYAQQDDINVRRAVAFALREIDDPRVLQSLVGSIPMPKVNANNAEPTGIDKPKYTLPTGPGGVNMPIYLPAQEVAGVAEDIDSPAAQLLKLIANKDLGSAPYTWANWYREKAGEISASERDEYRRNRTMRGRMGTPPSGSSGP
jgi:hypothetical protein